MSQPDHWIVYRDRQTGRQVVHNELGWFFADGPQELDADGEAIALPEERIERVTMRAVIPTSLPPQPSKAPSIEATETDIPGLFDVVLPGGHQLSDLTLGQIGYLACQNGYGVTFYGPRFGPMGTDSPSGRGERMRP